MMIGTGMPMSQSSPPRNMAASLHGTAMKRWWSGMVAQNLFGATGSGGPNRVSPVSVRPPAPCCFLSGRAWPAGQAAPSGLATRSAMCAPREPIGRSGPTVVSRAVWRSISAFSSAPTRMTVAEIQIHVMKPTMAPSEP